MYLLSVSKQVLFLRKKYDLTGTGQGSEGKNGKVSSQKMILLKKHHMVDLILD